MLRRGRVSAPPPEAPAAAPVKAQPVPAARSVTASGSIAQPLEAIVAVSDARERAAHDFTYHFSSNTERAAALDTLQSMARAVVANPSLASDAAEGEPRIAPAPSGGAATPNAAAAPRPTTTHPPATRGTAAGGRSRARVPAPLSATSAAFADEQLNA